MDDRKWVDGDNVGQKMLIETRASLAELAKCARVSRPTVAKWRDGGGIPREVARTALARDFGIPFDAWEEQLPRGTEIELIQQKPGRPTDEQRKRKRAKRPTPKAAQPAREDDEDDEDALDPIAGAAKRVAVIRDSPYPDPPGPSATIVESMQYSLACIRYDLRVRDLTTAARSKLRGDEARTLAHIAKLQRDEELRETHYVKNHPAFRAHCLKILEALRPFPDASKAVAKALNE